jgi:hypothetical protein
MVDFLVSEKPSSDDATKLWQDYMRKLCNGLPDCVGKLGILHMLLCNGPMCQCTWHVEDCINLVLGNQNPMHDNFLAAVATKSYDKLRELFPLIWTDILNNGGWTSPPRYGIFDSSNVRL